MVGEHERNAVKQAVWRAPALNSERQAKTSFSFTPDRLCQNPLQHPPPLIWKHFPKRNLKRQPLLNWYDLLFHSFKRHLLTNVLVQGVNAQLCEACEKLNFKHPTEIQKESIPWALEGRDIIGLAQTGSGKTAAFALPIIQKLWENPQPLFACVLAPTRELAYQIAETFEALGSVIGVRCAVIVGGMDMMTQSIALSKRPHVIVATPGRLQDHLENTKGFSLRALKYLIMDEADRLLDMDFGPKIDQILKVIPRERNTFLFSATMTTKVAKLQRASLSKPVKVEVATK